MFFRPRKNPAVSGSRPKRFDLKSVNSPWQVGANRSARPELMRCALTCLADVSRKISVRQPYLGLVFAFHPVHVDGNRFCCSRANQAIVYTWFLWSSCTFQLILLVKFCKFRNTSIEWFRSAAVDKGVYSQTRERANWISEHLLYAISHIFFMLLSTKCSTWLYRFSFFSTFFQQTQLAFLFFQTNICFLL